MFDHEAGYDTSDPKHPDAHGLAADLADDARKRAKEAILDANEGRPVMGCGHTANGTTADGAPVCLIDVGIDPAALIVAENPDLTGRRARCGDHGEVDSAFDLAFFEWRGPGSPAAARSCQECGYAPQAHELKKAGAPHLQKLVCDEFRAREQFEFDTYYCGCRGWD